MMTQRCPICGMRKMLNLHEKYFCEVCDVYFTDSLEPCVLPISNTFSDLDLCPSCKKLQDRFIECSHFREYMKKHVFCQICKRKLRGYLCYNFYKYFNLYRTKRRAFGTTQSLLLLLFFVLSLVADSFKIIVLFFDEICCRFSYRSFWKLLGLPLVKIPFADALFAVLVWRNLTKRVEIYRIPASFGDFSLQDGMGKLKISEGKMPFPKEKDVQKPFISKLEPSNKESYRHLEKKIRNLKI